MRELENGGCEGARSLKICSWPIINMIDAAKTDDHGRRMRLALDFTVYQRQKIWSKHRRNVPLVHVISGRGGLPSDGILKGRGQCGRGCSR